MVYCLKITYLLQLFVLLQQEITKVSLEKSIHGDMQPESGEIVPPIEF
jgi:hypothetical protein